MAPPIFHEIPVHLTTIRSMAVGEGYPNATARVPFRRITDGHIILLANFILLPARSRNPFTYYLFPFQTRALVTVQGAQVSANGFIVSFILDGGMTKARKQGFNASMCVSVFTHTPICIYVCFILYISE